MIDPTDDLPPMSPIREAAIRRLVVGHAVAAVEAKVRFRHRRWMIWTGAGLLAAGLGATAGSIVLQARSVSNDHIVHCLTSDRRSPDGSYPGPMASVATENERGRVDDALQVCKMMWEQGAMAPGFDPTSTTNKPGLVPPALIVCVLPDGSAAVVPSSDPAVCRELGLAPSKQD